MNLTNTIISGSLQAREDVRLWVWIVMLAMLAIPLALFAEVRAAEPSALDREVIARAMELTETVLAKGDSDDIGGEDLEQALNELSGLAATLTSKEGQAFHRELLPLLQPASPPSPSSQQNEADAEHPVELVTGVSFALSGVRVVHALQQSADVERVRAVRLLQVISRGCPSMVANLEAASALVQAAERGLPGAPVPAEALEAWDEAFKRMLVKGTSELDEVDRAAAILLLMIRHEQVLKDVLKLRIGATESATDEQAARQLSGIAEQLNGLRDRSPQLLRDRVDLFVAESLSDYKKLCTRYDELYRTLPEVQTSIFKLVTALKVGNTDDALGCFVDDLRPSVRKALVAKGRDVSLFGLPAASRVRRVTRFSPRYVSGAGPVVCVVFEVQGFGENEDDGVKLVAVTLGFRRVNGTMQIRPN